MQFTLELSVRGGYAEPEAIIEVARAAEIARFSLLGYTDHPAPSRKWLVSGGHPTFDPFAALGFLAATTAQIRLMSYLAVLPYRNPFLLAKSIASVDRLSGGRLVVGAGSGYLRSEFLALGVHFDQRNQTFEEVIGVLEQVFVDDNLHLRGHGYEAKGVVMDPSPVQLPRPPIWIGGTSKASRQRVVRYGDGWSPLLPSEEMARVVRSAPIPGIEGLARDIDDLHRMLEEAGRDPAAIPINLKGPDLFGLTPEHALDQIGRFADVGVTHLVVETPSDSPGAAVERIGEFGDDVICKAG